MNPGNFGETAEQLRRSTVQILNGERGEAGSGSGVIWDSVGLVVTNAHVLRHGKPRVELWDGRVFPATLDSRDDRRDLAALRINTFGLPAASPGDSSALRTGELVMAVGNPLGFVGALTTGVVHAIGPLRGLDDRSVDNYTMRTIVCQNGLCHSPRSARRWNFRRSRSRNWRSSDVPEQKKSAESNTQPCCWIPRLA